MLKEELSVLNLLRSFMRVFNVSCFQLVMYLFLTLLSILILVLFALNIEVETWVMSAWHTDIIGPLEFYLTIFLLNPLSQWQLPSSPCPTPQPLMLAATLVCFMYPSICHVSLSQVLHKHSWINISLKNIQSCFVR